MLRKGRRGSRLFCKQKLHKAPRLAGPMPGNFFKQICQSLDGVHKKSILKISVLEENAPKSVFSSVTNVVRLSSK
jgi:hypothetical protein